MKFFQRMEQKFGRYAIKNLMYYIIILYIIGIVIQMVAPGLYWNYLSLDAPAILHGQIWRVITFIIYPPMGSMAPIGSSIGMMLSDLLFNGLMLSLYYSLGTNLERTWGAFRFNVYFFMGILGHVLAAIIAYLVFHQYLLLTTTYLNMSLFFGFAAVYPDMQFLLFMVIPVKAKVLAVFDGLFFVYGFITGGAAERCAIILSLANFLIFFLMTRNLNRYTPKEVKRRREFRNQTKIVPKGAARHRCAVCGRTEKDGENLEFRYCSKCAGNLEYCQDHLYTHQHVTEPLPPQ